MRSFYVELEDQSLDIASVEDHYLSDLTGCEGSIEVHPELNRAIWVWFDADLVILDFDEWSGGRDGDDLVLISRVSITDLLFDEFIVGDSDVVVVLHMLHWFLNII